MIHDAFQPLSYWQNFMPAPQYEGVILDTHIYQVFSDEVSAAFTFGQGRIRIDQMNNFLDECVVGAEAYPRDL